MDGQMARWIGRYRQTERDRAREIEGHGEGVECRLQAWLYGTTLLPEGEGEVEGRGH